jgi:hypothetical protein
MWGKLFEGAARQPEKRTTWKGRFAEERQHVDVIPRVLLTKQEVPSKKPS